MLGGEREREYERVENSDGIEDRSRRGHVSTRTRLPLRLEPAVCFFPFSFLSLLLVFSFPFLYVFVGALLIFFNQSFFISPLSVSPPHLVIYV